MFFWKGDKRRAEEGRRELRKGFSLRRKHLGHLLLFSGALMGQRGGRWLWRKEAAQGDKCGVGVGVSPEGRRPGNTSLRLKSAR